MALETLSVTLVGRRPLLMHNGRLADPTNPAVRAIKPIATKRGKTEADFEELKRLEWLGGLYLDENGAISVSEDMVLACVVEGARKSKKGKQATAGVLGAAPYYPLRYDGPRDPIDLFNAGTHCDYRTVVVGQARTMRARPCFPQWSLDVSLLVETNTINPNDVTEALEIAGSVIGLGDFRPRYGRFAVE